ncbi:sodium-dependent phosphate transporter 2-like isoform X2 [Clavelina lepadiformis]|uniref:sodium-dependent phosphate transporter 2-like isoform X2 n=1 Tax=Clavelina lepadiformis TaxID=159417 RepID=UPI00404152A8
MATFSPTTNIFAGFSSGFTTAMLPAWSQENVLWLLIVGFIVGFILAFAVGANDVANSFGTTVGAKVLTLKQACVLATVFEATGAALLGAKVGETIRKGIIDVHVYDFEDGAKVLMMGEVAAMFGAAMWQIIATILKLPVSGTHSIVGACIGFSLVAVGSSGVRWASLGFIVASWFVSPVLAGFMAVLLYYFMQRYIINTDNPLKTGLLALPFFFAITVGSNVFSILYSGAPLLGFNNLPIWSILLMALGVMVLVAITTRVIAVPRIRSRADKLHNEIDAKTCITELTSLSQSEKGDGEFLSLGAETKANLGSRKAKINHLDSHLQSFREETSKISKETSLSDYDHHFVDSNSFKVQLTSPADSEFSFNGCDLSDDRKKEKDAKVDENDEEDPATVRELFSSLQVLTACFASFAHGGNDVSNAIGPLIALWIIFWSGEVVQKAFTPWYLLLYGSLGITVGLWLLGRRIMETIGKDITKVTPSRGFCIELMTAMTVLIASNLGIPVSTTHCKVGAVVSIGWYRSRSAVEWSIVRNIAFAWFVTLPVSGLISAGAMHLLMRFL